MEKTPHTPIPIHIESMDEAEVEDPIEDISSRVV